MVTRGRWRPAGLVLAVCAAGVLSGCASAQEPEVEKVATAFENPSGDPQARCGLLAPATLQVFEQDASAPCAQAITQVQLPGGQLQSVQVWGGDAQVKLADDTLFLTETDSGWKVTAAACESRGQAPYDCDVEGP